MQEGLWAMALCRHGKYHVPPTLIPYVLDEENDRPLPRIGRQTGRFAFFDLLPETSWGGYITSDHVTITWDSPARAAGAAHTSMRPSARSSAGRMTRSVAQALPAPWTMPRNSC